MGSNPKGRTMMEVGADGVAIITIINPTVNSLSLDVLKSLKDSFDQALRRDDVKAIVVTGAKGKFSGGFDITPLGGFQGGKTARKPSVAAIDGLALGGGLEVAMACHARTFSLKKAFEAAPADPTLYLTMQLIAGSDHWSWGKSSGNIGNIR